MMYATAPVNSANHEAAINAFDGLFIFLVFDYGTKLESSPEEIFDKCQKVILAWERAFLVSSAKDD